MRPCAWFFGFPHSSAIAQIIVRVLKFCLSLCDFSTFVFHGVRLSFCSLMYFGPPYSVCILLQINCNVFYVCEVILYIDYWYFLNSWKHMYFTFEKNSKFVIPMFMTVVSVFYVCEVILCIYYWYFLNSWNHMYFTFEKKSMFVIPMFVTVVSVPRTTRLYSVREVWRREELTREVEGRGVSQWLERSCGTTLFLPVGRNWKSVGWRKCRLFLIQGVPPYSLIRYPRFTAARKKSET
jgi:hypothetical protein